MTSKLDKYIGKSILHIKSYVIGLSDIIIPDIYLDKIEQYGGKLSVNDIILELYSLLINSENKQIRSNVLNRVIDVLLLCGEYIPDESSLKTLIGNIYMDVLFTIILVGCNKKISQEKLQKLTDLITNNYLESVDTEYNFPLSQKLSLFSNPLLVIVKLLNKKNKSNKYVKFLKSQITPEENKLLNEQLGGLFSLTEELNNIDEFNKFNKKILDIVGGGNSDKNNEDDENYKKIEIKNIDSSSFIKEYTKKQYIMPYTLIKNEDIVNEYIINEVNNDTDIKDKIGSGVPTLQPSENKNILKKYILGVEVLTKNKNNKNNKNNKQSLLVWYQDGNNNPEWMDETKATELIQKDIDAEKKTKEIKANNVQQPQQPQQQLTEKPTESVNKLISELSPSDKTSLISTQKYISTMIPNMIMKYFGNLLK
jgi:hypothetical protein